MKIVGLIASLLVGFISTAQNSYYFSTPLSPTETIRTQINAKYFGSYSSLEQPSHYEVSETGVYLISTNISSISRETVRESSQYTVRNGFILGILKNDSVPCILQGEKYVFGVQNKELIIGSGSLNVLTKTDDYGNYIINTYENGKYIPMKFSFQNGSLSIAYFDYDSDSDSKSFKFINEQTSTPIEKLNVVILSPSEKEIKRLFRNNLFGESRTFNKI